MAFSIEEYQEYLKTDKWNNKRKERLKIDNYQCCMCGCNGTMNNKLEIHHFTYRNIYNEDVYKDLLTLCSNCHKSVHYMMNRKTSADGKRGWKDELKIANHVIAEAY